MINKSGSLGNNNQEAFRNLNGLPISHVNKESQNEWKTASPADPPALKTLEGKRGPKEKIRDVS